MSQTPSTGPQATDLASPRVDARARRNRRNWAGGRVASVGLPVVAIAAAIVLWWLIVELFNVSEFIVPSPFRVIAELVNRFDILMVNLWPTLIESVAGFALGNAVAILLAILFVHAKAAETAIFPIAVFIRTMPIVAVAPILVIIFGTGYTPKVIIAALISFFPTLVNMVRGFQAVDKQTLELMRVLSASRTELFFKIRVYASLPYLFSALKIAATSSVIGAMVAEWVGASEGLGYLIIQTTYTFETPLLYATMVIASIFATVFFAAIGIVEKLVVRWQPKEVA